MHNEPSIQLGKWYGLLIFAAGSVLTGIVARVTPYDNGNPLLTLMLFYWTLFGTVAGLWMLRGRSWRALARDTRLRLGLAYLAIGWGGLFGLSVASDIVNFVFIAPGIALVIVFAASIAESLLRKRDEGDIFP